MTSNGPQGKNPIEAVLGRVQNLIDLGTDNPLTQTRISDGDGGHIHIPSNDGTYTLQQYQAALVSISDFWDQVPESIYNTIVRNALYECIRNDSIDSESYRRAVKEEQRRFCKSQQQEFTVIATVSIPESVDDFSVVSPGIGPTREAEIEIISCGLDDFRSSPAWEPRLKGLADQERLIPEEYSNVRVVLKARNVAEAVESALLHLDRMRGYWSVMLLGKKRLLSPLSPYISFVYGPKLALLERDVTHTLTEAYPYLPRHCLSNASSDTYEEVYTKVSSHLEKQNYRPALDRAFITYARVMEKRDASAVLVGLCTVLEILCATTDHGKLIERASFVGEDRSVDRSILKSLRHHRNAYVHKLDTSGTTDVLIDLVDKFVARLFDVHLNLGDEFRSIEDLAERMLDLPNDSRSIHEAIDNRDEEIALLKRARSFLKDKDLISER